MNCIGSRTITLCNALDTVEENLQKTQERRDTKHVMCEDKHKYSCGGTQACRGDTGICTMHCALKKINPQSQKRIIKLFQQTKELYRRFVDTGQIRLVKVTVDFVQVKTFFSTPRECKESK